MRQSRREFQTEETASVWGYERKLGWLGCGGGKGLTHRVRKWDFMLAVRTDSVRGM